MGIFGFSTLFFIFAFLPVFLLVYWIFPGKFSNLLLLLGGLCFYALGDVYLCGLLAILTVINYLLLCLSCKMEKGRVVLFWGTVLLHAGVLGAFKMEGFVPIGLSFYIFQMLALFFDVYKDKEPISFVEYGAFVCMFPKLLMGPIVNKKTLQSELAGKRIFRADLFEKGCMEFAFGLGLKVLLADVLATLVNSIRVGGSGSLTLGTAWLYAFAYSMELYFDFWGYSRMATGLGKMLGFSLPDNFRTPYASKTVGEFYRRWHITLGAWFKEYIYIPLGGNRKGCAFTILNLTIVWIVTGVWHGEQWNFLIWAGVLLILILLERFTAFGRIKDTRLLGHLYVMCLLPVSWVIFSISDLGELCSFLLGLVGALPGETLWDMQLLRYMNQYFPFIVMGFLFLTPLPENIMKRISEKIVVKLLLLVIFWGSVYLIFAGQTNPFLYFSF